MIHIRGVKFKFAEGHTRIMVALKGPGGCGWVVMDSSMLLTLRGACGGGAGKAGRGDLDGPSGGMRDQGERQNLVHQRRLAVPCT